MPVDSGSDEETPRERYFEVNEESCLTFFGSCLAGGFGKSEVESKSAGLAGGKKRIGLLPTNLSVAHTCDCS